MQVCQSSTAVCGCLRSVTQKEESQHKDTQAGEEEKGREGKSFKQAAISKVQSEECCLYGLYWQREERRSWGELGEEKEAREDGGDEDEEEEGA